MLCYSAALNWNTCKERKASAGKFKTNKITMVKEYKLIIIKLTWIKRRVHTKRTIVQDVAASTMT